MPQLAVPPILSKKDEATGAFVSWEGFAVGDVVQERAVSHQLSAISLDQATDERTVTLLNPVLDQRRHRVHSNPHLHGLVLADFRFDFLLFFLSFFGPAQMVFGKAVAQKCKSVLGESTNLNRIKVFRQKTVPASTNA